MSDSAIDRIRARREKRHSFLDVLALALAKTGGGTFTGDSRRWSQTVRELRDEHGDLLSGIWFSERGYSEQLEDFFRVMARSGILSFANPRFERITMSKDAVKSLTDGASAALEKHTADIDKIAKRLEELKEEAS